MLHLDSSIRCNNRIRCGNACLQDFHNLCDIVNIGWKRKYSDRRTKCFSICMKPTLFSVQMNGE